MPGAEANCRVCGRPARLERHTAHSSDPRFAGSEYVLERCEECGSSVLASERPPPDELYRAGVHPPTRPSIDRLLEPLRRLANRERMRFVPRLPADGRVLEVGAGEGRFVETLSARGLDARGIDAGPSSSPLVQHIQLEEVPPPAEPLDLVAFWHVLEHFDEPAEPLRRIRAWLKPDGRVLIAVPNAAGLQAAIGGDRWFQQDVPRHAVQFTPAGLLALLERCGFEPLRLSTFSVDQNFLGMWQTLLNRLTGGRDVGFRLLKHGVGRPKARDVAATLLAAAPLVPAAVAVEACAGILGRGGSIIVVARRT